MVQALQGGQARNRTLAACARMCWMVQVVLYVKISYQQVAAVMYEVADALSRASGHHNRVTDHIYRNKLTLISPSVYVFDNPHVLIKFKSVLQLAPGQGRRAVARGTDI